MKQTNNAQQHSVHALTALDPIPSPPAVGDHHPAFTNGCTEGAPQRTHYLDTASYHLLRTCFIARLEEDGDQRCLTVENRAAELTGKVDKQIRRRATVTAPLAAADDALQLKMWPKTVRKAVASCLPKHAKFQPIFIPSALPTGVRLQPQMLVVDACRLIWHEQLMTMILNEAGVRYSQERAYVHNMRVAIRRARAAAKLYGHFFPRKTIRPYLTFLRKTGRLLGQVRNLDVTLAKARRSHSDGEASAPAPKKWLKAWQEQRQAAHESLVAWFDNTEYSDLLAAFQEFCTAPLSPTPQSATAIPQQVRHVIPLQIWEGFGAVRAYETLFETEALVAPELLHKLRIACKHLRYNLEFVCHLLGPECEALLQRLKALQDLLGDLNDALVAQTLLAERKQDQETLAYQQAQAQLVNQLRRAAPTAFAALVNQESREQLGKALARL